MAIDFPNSPSSGDIYTVNGKQWSWDGAKWLAYGASLAPDILKIDTGNNRVGINQTSPTVALDVTGSARITGDLTVSGTTVTVDSASVLIKDRVQFEGATANDYETILLATDPTADRTITLPDATGTVAMTSGLAAYLPLAGGTLSGTVNAADQIISKAVFKDVGETLATNGTSGSAATIDLEDGNFHKVTLTANCTLTFSNPPASGTAGSFTLFLVQDGTGSRTVTWPGTVDWSAATAPTLTTTAAAVDVLTFITLDGGTIWNGFVAGQAMG